MIDLSVIITCYNKEKYLEECIDSVIQNSKQPKEVIVVHDGCKSPSHHVSVTSIMTKNQGVSKARHEGFRFSTGKLVLFLDGDDKLFPDFIERMVPNMLEVDITYPNWFLANGVENELVEVPDELDLHKRNSVLISSMMKRQVYEKLGGFRDYPIYEDWDFWLRAEKEGFKFKKANTSLWYRQTADSRNRKSKSFRESIYRKIIGGLDAQNQI